MIIVRWNGHLAVHAWSRCNVSTRQHLRIYEILLKAQKYDIAACCCFSRLVYCTYSLMSHDDSTSAAWLSNCPLLSSELNRLNLLKRRIASNETLDMTCICWSNPSGQWRCSTMRHHNELATVIQLTTDLHLRFMPPVQCFCSSLADSSWILYVTRLIKVSPRSGRCFDFRQVMHQLVCNSKRQLAERNLLGESFEI